MTVISLVFVFFNWTITFKKQIYITCKSLQLNVLIEFSYFTLFNIQSVCSILFEVISFVFIITSVIDIYLIAMTEYTSIYKVIKTQKHYEDNISCDLRKVKKITLKEFPKYFLYSNCQIIT